MNKPESIFYQLLLKKINGEITEDEMLQLIDLLKTFPEFSAAYETVQWLWNDAGVSSRAGSREKHEQLWEQHFQKMQDAGMLPEAGEPRQERSESAYQGRKSAPQQRWKRRYMIAAAALAVAVGVAAFIIYAQRRDAPGKVQPNVVMTRPGSRSKLILPDGTTVWLNANSRLSYGNDFMKAERKVQLDGEAFFDVVKDEQRPFIINTPVMNVKVLGTRFNLRSYAGDRKSEAVLIAGRIEVQVKRRPEERYLLSPYEKLSLIENKVTRNKPADNNPAVPPVKALVISNVSISGEDSTVAETAWVDNKLVFAGEPLGELAVRMERWFGATITVQDSSLQHFKVSGSFRSESLEEALKAISLITGCRYKLKDHAAVLYY